MGKKRQGMKMQKRVERLENIRKVQDERRRMNLAGKATIFDRFRLWNDANSFNVEYDTNGNVTNEVGLIGLSGLLSSYEGEVGICIDATYLVDILFDRSLDYCNDENAAPLSFPLDTPFEEVWAITFHLESGLPDNTFVSHPCDILTLVSFSENEERLVLICAGYIWIQGEIAPYEACAFAGSVTNGALELSGINTTKGSTNQDACRRFIYSFFVGISELLMMRNVELVDNPPDPKVSAQYEREFGRPISTYKTLAIKPTRKVYPDSDEESDNDSEKRHHRAHLVRGHARKVEGHPFIPDGTYWIPAHTRGDFDAGIVVKDYKLKPE